MTATILLRLAALTGILVLLATIGALTGLYLAAVTP